MQYLVKIKWDHAHDQTFVPYPWTIKWKDQTLFSFYQSFGIRVKNVHIYVNILICRKVGSVQNVCLVIGGRLVMGVSTLIGFCFILVFLSSILVHLFQYFTYLLLLFLFLGEKLFPFVTNSHTFTEGWFLFHFVVMHGRTEVCLCTCVHNIFWKLEEHHFKGAKGRRCQGRWLSSFEGHHVQIYWIWRE